MIQPSLSSIRITMLTSQFDYFRFDLDTQETFKKPKLIFFSLKRQAHAAVLICYVGVEFH